MPTVLRKMMNRLNAVAGIGIERTLFYELGAGEPVPDLPLAADLTVIRVSPEDAQLLCQAQYADAGLNRSRFEEGDSCYAALLAGRLAHHSWVKRRGLQQVPEAGREYPVQPGEFWIYHCWTAEWARGKKIYPCVLAHMTREQFQQGLKLARIYTIGSNVASQHGIARAGFRLCYTLRAFRFGSRCFPIGHGPVAAK